jgi:MoxR-like ATPase
MQTSAMDVASVQETYARLRAEANKVIVGQEAVFEQLVVALLTGGHVLLEGVPGTAKTLMAKTLALLVRADFTRLQFTPDLMPSDVIGTVVFESATATFRLKKGPLFTQILLADEINRAPAKTQSALLEAMEERQVSIEGERHVLPAPFLVLATQNPIEYEGTYPLPEAQLDRFLFKVRVPYAPAAVEREVLQRYHGGFDAHDLAATGIAPVLTPEGIAAIQATVRAVTVEAGIMDYIVAIAEASRRSPDLVLGGSPRASISLLLAAKTVAALAGRDFVTPDDVKSLVAPVYRHRVILKPEAEIEGLDADAVLGRLLGRIEVPR